MDSQAPLPKYDYYKGPQKLPDLWTRARATLTMRCAISTHAHGWELKLTAGSGFSRTQICRTQSEVFALADTWAQEASAKGWN